MVRRYAYDMNWQKQLLFISGPVYSWAGHGKEGKWSSSAVK